MTKTNAQNTIDAGFHMIRLIESELARIREPTIMLAGKVSGYFYDRQIEALTVAIMVVSEMKDATIVLGMPTEKHCTAINDLREHRKFIIKQQVYERNTKN